MGDTQLSLLAEESHAGQALAPSIQPEPVLRTRPTMPAELLVMTARNRKDASPCFGGRGTSILLDTSTALPWGATIRVSVERPGYVSCSVTVRAHTGQVRRRAHVYPADADLVAYLEQRIAWALSAELEAELYDGWEQVEMGV